MANEGRGVERARRRGIHSSKVYILGRACSLYVYVSVRKGFVRALFSFEVQNRKIPRRAGGGRCTKKFTVASGAVTLLIV